LVCCQRGLFVQLVVALPGAGLAAAHRP
jgi:hypothetical protein